MSVLTAAILPSAEFSTATLRSEHTFTEDTKDVQKLAKSTDAIGVVASMRNSFPTRIEVFCASRLDVETTTQARSAHVVISIRDPESPKPTLRPHRLRRAVLSLAFDDAVPTAEPDGSLLMTLADANAIWRFVSEHLPYIGAVIVHCEQGVSRSPAVAAGLLLGLDQSAADIFDGYKPNLFVLRLMLEAREKPTNAAPDAGS